MNILNNNYYYNHAVSFVKDQTVPFVKNMINRSLTLRQKQVGIIAAAALASIIAFYLIYRLCCTFTSKDRAKGIYLDKGYIQTGEFSNGRCVKETRTYVDGIIDEGSFYKNCLHGKGKRTYPTGEIQEGDFIKGYLHGHAKITYPDGTVVEGNFINDCFII